MKLIVVSILSWLIGVCAYLFSLKVIYDESIGRADLLAVLYLSAMASAVTCAVLYVPLMFLLRRVLGGCKPVFAFPLAASLVFVLPAMLVMVGFGGAASIPSRLLSPEAFLFYCMFFAVGVFFGFGFAWSYRNTPPNKRLQLTAR